MLVGWVMVSEHCWLQDGMVANVWYLDYAVYE